MNEALSSSIVAFLTDFGLTDGYVGVMKGVVLGIAPQVYLIDISHEIPPQDIAAGAWVLATSYRYFPKGTVFTCVVDPGVGSERHPIAVRAGDWCFVGPDNGLFHYIVAQQPVHEAVTITNPAYHLAQVSHTFHGRDIFSPVSAHIARGVPLSKLGERVEPASLQRLPLAEPQLQHGRIQAQVIYIDHFGNLVTNIPLSLVPDLFERQDIALSFPKEGFVTFERRQFFATTGEDNGEPFMFGDSSGHIAVAIRNGNAARTLGIRYGSPVTLIVPEK